MNHSAFSLKYLIAILSVFAALTLGIYSNTFTSPFIFDDLPYILNDPHIRMTELTWNNIEKAALEGSPRHRLLPNVSFAVNYYFGRYHVTGYHVINVMIHIFTGIILFAFIKFTVYLESRRSEKPDYPLLIPFFTAMIWLAHPVNTQTVTYTCQRMAGMAAMFYILSMLFYVYARSSIRSEPRCYAKGFVLFIGCIISGVCAVGSKENAGALPLFILLYEWFFFQDLKSIRTNKKFFLIICGLSLLFGIIAIIYLGENPVTRILKSYTIRDFTLPQRLMTESRVVVYYISLFFFPFPARLTLEHDYPLSLSFIDPITTVISIITIIALIGMAVGRARRDRLGSFCILWFFGNLLIESSVIGIEIIFEHRTYLPFMMASLLLVILITRIIKHKKLMAGLLGCALILISIWTYQRNDVFGNGVKFLNDCVIKSPNKIRPRNNLATTLQLNGKTPEAIRNFLKILAIDPNYVTAYNNLGNIYAAQNKADKALDYYISALEIDPALDPYHVKDFASVHFNLGSVLMHHRMTNEAIFHFRQGMKINPNNAKAHSLLGKALMQQKQFRQAAIQFEKAVQLDPESRDAKENLQYLKNNPHKLFDANDTTRVKSILYPDNEQFHLKLAAFYQKQNKFNRAAIQYKKVLLIDPSNTHALYNLGACFALLGQHEKSLKTFNRLKMLKNKR